MKIEVKTAENSQKQNNEGNPSDLEKKRKAGKMSFKSLLNTSIQNEQGYWDYVKAAYDEWAQKKEGNPPQFFTGSIDSKVAMISLNPHAGHGEIDYCEYCDTWDNYRRFFSNFPQERYAENGRAVHVTDNLSRFDKELHCFFSGNRDPNGTDLERWNIFHLEISHMGTPNYVRNHQETPSCCLLRALEAISLKDRSLVVLLNRDGCNLIDQMINNHTLQNPQRKINRYPVIKSNGETITTTRLDYSFTLPNKKEITLVATPTFPLKQVANRFVFLSNYYDKVFTNDEKKILKQGLGIKK